MTFTDERPAPQSGHEAAGSHAARRAMIDSQLRTTGVNDPWLLTRMAAVPREAYVPAQWQAAAYADRAVPLGDGHYLAAPEFHGRLLVEAAPTPDDTVLVVSPAGYVADLLKPVVRKVETLAPAAAAEAGKGHDASLILVDGAIEHLPDSLAARLAANGRIVTGLVERGVTRLAVGRKAAGQVTFLPLAEIGIPILREFAAPRRWSF